MARGKASKNNPDVRRKQEVVVTQCEFCGSEDGVHMAMISKLTGPNKTKRKGRMMKVCKDDNCTRFEQ